MPIHRAIKEFEEMVLDKEKYRQFLYEWLRYSWRWAKQEKYKLVFKIQASILRAIREKLDSMGFGPATDPGIRGAKQVTIDFYGLEYRVMSSAILYKQYMAATLGKIYFVSPNVRLEPLDSIYTGRHLVEFFQVDLEMYNASYHDAMRVAEELFCYVVKYVKDVHGKELEQVFNRQLPDFKPPFPKYTYQEAHRILCNELGCKFEYGTEIPWECEKLLSAMHDTPIFIIEYPKKARGFYYREDPTRPGTLLDFDMLYPEGFGEAISGAEREYEPDKVIARIKESGEDPSKYEWFLEMLRELYPLRTAGFGIGVERLTRYICGLRAVWEARPYPKLAGIGPTP